MDEQTTIPITRYRDAHGEPTCAADFDAGRVCTFYRTARFGSMELCGASPLSDEAGIVRRDGGRGTLVPVCGCPVWRHPGA